VGIIRRYPWIKSSNPIVAYRSRIHAPAPKGPTVALEVAADSMIDAHIVAGDVVYMEPNSVIHHRDIVAALIDGETTLKRF